MNRTVLKILCIVSGILFVIFVALTILSVTAELDRINQRGGIIAAPMGAPLPFWCKKLPGSMQQFWRCLLLPQPG